MTRVTCARVRFELSKVQFGPCKNDRNDRSRTFSRCSRASRRSRRCERPRASKTSVENSVGCLRMDETVSGEDDGRVCWRATQCASRWNLSIVPIGLETTKIQRTKCKSIPASRRRQVPASFGDKLRADFLVERMTRLAPAERCSCEQLVANEAFLADAPEASAETGALTCSETLARWVACSVEFRWCLRMVETVSGEDDGACF